MSHNSFGQLLRFTSWGESHGEEIGCVLDGVPPRISLSEDDIQPFLDKRRPGLNSFTTQRCESDLVRIVSGVFEGRSTGAPLSMIIKNEDMRSKDYSDIRDKYRPSHADYTYDVKYGFRDYRGGGRSSARETAMRVAGGAVARKILLSQMSDSFRVRGAMVSMGGDAVGCWDDSVIAGNDFFCCDGAAVKRWSERLLSVRKSGDSLGGVIEVRASGVMGGLGAPLYGRLDSDIASAMMSIPAVKGVEIGSGFSSAGFLGSENADEMRMLDDEVSFLSNHAGGILGGISNGDEIIVRFAVKPTSSILSSRKSVDKFGKDVDIETRGRHDPCVGIRAVPIGEAMLCLVLADHFLRHRGQCGS